MTIYEVNKYLSSENKSKIISHFWNCYCKGHDVTMLSKKLEIEQSNLSKHLKVLVVAGILGVTQNHKVRYYEINRYWKKEWQEIVEPQVLSKENLKYQCTCEVRNDRD